MILPRTQITKHKRQTKPRMVSKWVTSDLISVFSLQPVIQVEMLNLLTDQNLGSCQSWLLRCWNTSKACWSIREEVVLLGWPHEWLSRFKASLLPDLFSPYWLKLSLTVLTWAVDEVLMHSWLLLLVSPCSLRWRIVIGLLCNIDWGEPGWIHVRHAQFSLHHRIEYKPLIERKVFLQKARLAVLWLTTNLFRSKLLSVMRYFSFCHGIPPMLVGL